MAAQLRAYDWDGAFALAATFEEKVDVADSKNRVEWMVYHLSQGDRTQVRHRGREGWRERRRLVLEGGGRSGACLSSACLRLTQALTYAITSEERIRIESSEDLVKAS